MTTTMTSSVPSVPDSSAPDSSAPDEHLPDAHLPDAHLPDAHRSLALDADLDARVRQLVPCAVQEQLWLILLDENDVQMPVMIPIGDLPANGPCDDEACSGCNDCPMRSDCEELGAERSGLVGLLRKLTEEFGAASFVFILERSGPPDMTDFDRRWLRLVRKFEERGGVRVRATYICHDGGVGRSGCF